jgi:acetyl/propionyl-CoA carboxylase alpha subunit
VITKLLVANRGEITRRIFRTCRELGIATVAVHSDPDADMPFVAEADEAVRLPGASSTDTYLRVDLILAAAKATGADAVHPGYGFLSENADFARAVVDAGLTWVGPPPDAIAAMGSKLEAKRLVSAGGVPILPTWGPGDDIPGEAFPVLVKASAGGGGRGMRLVSAPADLAAAVEAAQGEAQRSFGDGTVFVERYVQRPRHVEIQVFADTHGNVVSLYERECSIQRRHQKIVEESPSPAVDEALRQRMGAAAVAAAKAVGYVGAGTVEFVLAPDGEFAFLEMNTRLQVEHPVTELVTGLDLVALQVRVAEGERLPEVPPMRGHAIEVRLYAENAERNFLPVTGTVEQFQIPDSVRVDSGVESGSVVSHYYDPMLAKVVSWAPTRAAAARTLATALATARIHGLVTNRDLLVRILRDEEFLAGGTDTGFLERHDPADLGRPLADAGAEAVHALAAALAGQAAARARAAVWPDLPSGWRNNPSQPQQLAFEGRYGRHDVAYTLERDGLHVDGHDGLRLLSAGPTEVTLETDGVRRVFRVRHSADRWHVDSPLGYSALTEVPRFPDPAHALDAGSLTAPMPGSVLRVEVAPGTRVRAGQQLVVLEAMKMQHAVTAPADGTVAEVRVDTGQQVDAGTVLVVMEEPA